MEENNEKTEGKIEELEGEAAEQNRIDEQNKKLEEVVTLYERIQGLLPNSSIGLNVHDIDIKNLDTRVWKIKANYQEETKSVYLSATRPGKGSFDIILYD